TCRPHGRPGGRMGGMDAREPYRRAAGETRSKQVGLTLSAEAAGEELPSSPFLADRKMFA
ncbi:MAG: hypothetical protein ACKOTB_16765, partial [Planctomycetia bacterium]